jgi:hypothetical protein
MGDTQPHGTLPPLIGSSVRLSKARTSSRSIPKTLINFTSLSFFFKFGVSTTLNIFWPYKRLCLAHSIYTYKALCRVDSNIYNILND